MGQGYLEGLAVNGGAMRYWTDDGEPLSGNAESCSYYCRQPKTNAIEMSAYALLTYAARGDIARGLPVMKWLLTKQSKFGGYGSTQDTVIGIMALSKFAVLFSAGDSLNLDINIRGLRNDVQIFTRDFTTISAQNNNIFQQQDVNADIDQIVVTARGVGVALVQASVTYNVMEEPESGIVQTCYSDLLANADVEVRCCATWNETEGSGMVVAEIHPLTGYSIQTENFLEMNPIKSMKRFEVNGQKMAIYFDEFTATETCFMVRETPTAPVKNLKEALIKTFVYYEPTASRSSQMYLPDALREVPTDESELLSGAPTLGLSCAILLSFVLAHFL